MRLRRKFMVSFLALSLVIGGLVSVPFASAISYNGELPEQAESLFERVNQVFAELDADGEAAVEATKTEVAAATISDGFLDALLVQIHDKALDNGTTAEYASLRNAVKDLFVHYGSKGLEDLDEVFGGTQLFVHLAAIAEEDVPDIADIAQFVTELMTAVESTIKNATLSELLTIKSTVSSNLEAAIDNSSTITSAIFESLGYDATSILAMINALETEFPSFKTAKVELAIAYLTLLEEEDDSDSGSGGGDPTPTTPIVTIPPVAEEIIDEVSKALDDLADAPADQQAEALETAKKAVEKAIKEASVLDVSNLVVTNNGVASVQVNVNQITTQFAQIQQQAQQLNNRLLELDENVKPAKVVATISLGNVNADQAEVAINQSLVTAAKQNGIQALAIEVNGVSLQFDVDELTEDHVISITTQDQSVIADNSERPLASDVYTFEFTSGGQGSKSFNKPVNITIPIPSTENVDPDLLTLAKIESDGSLTFYGGKYNEDDGTFTAKRSSFSSYTVVENKVSFNDTDSVRLWAGRQIDVVAAKGIIEGRGEQAFDPSANITRAEFAKLIVKTFGLENDLATESFADVQDDDWFRPYVAVAAEAGIVNGRSATIFDPHAEITRAEMATMASRALIYALDYNELVNENEVLSTFVDESDIQSTLRTGVALAAAHGIVIGMGDGEFNPNSSSTRAQAAVLIYRLINL